MQSKYIEKSSISNKSLDYVLSHIKENPLIDAIFIMGSIANNTDDKYSDIDLVFIVNELPKNILSINTYIENKFAEIYLYTKKEVESLLIEYDIDPFNKNKVLIDWLKNSKIIVDKSSLLKKIKDKNINTHKNINFDSEIYIYWMRINYNYIQNLRYFNSNKKLYLEALDIRLLYSITELLKGYFIIRRMEWEGEKNAIKYWVENDPELIISFREYNIEIDRSKKMELYKKLSNKALEPIGGICKENTTSIFLIKDYTDNTIKEGFSLWNKLLKGI